MTPYRIEVKITVLEWLKIKKVCMSMGHKSFKKFVNIESLEVFLFTHFKRRHDSNKESQFFNLHIDLLF